jgi:hypothetical protein
MSETLRFYGPVQGMIRIDNFKPAGYGESTRLADVIRTQGCSGCSRLDAQQTPDQPNSYPCEGVHWIGLDSAYLEEHQGHAVHHGGNVNCQLLNITIQVPSELVVEK